MNIKSKILNISIDNIAEMLRSDVIPDEPGQSGDITLINTCRNMWPEWVTDFLGPFKEEDSCVLILHSELGNVCPALCHPSS